MATIAGGSTRNRGSTRGQREANRQPAGGCARSGGDPGIPCSVAFGPLMDGNDCISARVYGCLGSSKRSRVLPSSTIWPAYMTARLSEKLLTSDMAYGTNIAEREEARRISLH